jgi:ComF family protein
MIARLIHGLKAIVYPKVCLSCKKKLAEKSDEEILCSQCQGKIKKNLPPFCASCGRQLDKRWFTENICPACQKKDLSFDRAYSPCSYEGVVKELIHKFKYNGSQHLGEPLSRLMSEFVREYSLPIDYVDCIIPVPLHKTRLREREFNQSEILGKHLAREFNKELVSNAIERFRHTKTQTELITDQRASNVKDCFRVIDPRTIKDKNILLIDDVLTTGATSSEAAAALKDAGANIVLVLTIAN